MLKVKVILLLLIFTMVDSQNNSKTNYVLAGFGNPLLDIYVIVKDNAILEKFNLQPDGQKEVDEMELKTILNSVLRNKNELIYRAGGAAQNTLRILQHLIETPSFTIFFGGCGCDNQSEILLAQAKNSCVETRYAIQEEKPTGTAISLINGDKRSLVAHLGAANIYTLYDLQSQDNIKIIQNVSVVYIEGFFLPHSFNVALEIVKICRQHGNTIIVNLSGAYLFAKHASEVLALAALADIVIGNKSEFLALVDFLKTLNSSLKEILFLVKSLDYTQYIPYSEDFVRKKSYKLEQMMALEKVVICTDGENPVHTVYQNSEFVTFKVPHLDSSLIKDTTGAGDAFAAGFIVGLIKKMSVIECMELGCTTAQRVIQSVGCFLSADS